MSAMTLPEMMAVPYSSVWDTPPKGIRSVQPGSFEEYGQDYGFMLYSTTLTGHKSGRLTVIDIHDYATVFLNGTYIEALDRRLGISSIDLPRTDVKDLIPEIFTEGMGRINFAHAMIDRKGITDRVILNSMTLMNWDVYAYPMSEEFIKSLRQATQQRLNCPAPWFKTGENEIIIFDLHKSEAGTLRGFKTMQQ